MTQSKFVEANGLRIHYLEDGAGPPLLLLHGGLATAEMSWNEPLPDLAKSYRVLAPDSRDHGQTNNPAQSLSYAQMADDVAAFIDGLGLSPPAIFGYSDGGQIALEFGLRHPGKARSLVFGGTIVSMADGYLEMLHEWGFPEVGEVDLAALERGMGDFFQSIKISHGPTDQPDYYLGFLKQISELWLTVPTYDAGRLAMVTDPALVICGDRDGAAIIQAPTFAKALGKGELAVVPNTAHEAAMRPLFWESVKDFLVRHTA
jgi:pimeloyl-ACP methyl ester carboxylesterase